ncbi:MAG: hypothetical protein M3389_11495 [Actinomycetota bacterium]|nr:hypothetical protein [Actinomycetota bacterium]
MAFPRSHLARTAAALAATGAFLAAGGAVATGADAPASMPRCADLDLPARPPERVWCTTPNATLSIAHQADPVLLEGTEVRVLSGTFDGYGTIEVRLRVRNQTPAEQGLSAGGQELYLYLDGQRIDASLLRVVRFLPGEAKTVTLEYALAPEQVAALQAGDGRLDFGVRPWTDAPAPAPLIGVVRMRVAV